MSERKSELLSKDLTANWNLMSYSLGFPWLWGRLSLTINLDLMSPGFLESKKKKAENFVVFS